MQLGPTPNLETACNTLELKTHWTLRCENEAPQTQAFDLRRYRGAEQLVHRGGQRVVVPKASPAEQGEERDAVAQDSGLRHAK